MSDSTKILSFTRKRGRPKNNRPLIDTGTPETVMKRLLGMTTEVLDLCLEHGIINRKQHWCGIHLRWLYTLRYGVPSVKSTDLSEHKSNYYNNNENDDPMWKAERELEYSEAISLLNQNGYALLIMNICIFNEPPKFFNLLSDPSRTRLPSVVNNSHKIREGLDILAKLWKST